MLVREPRNEVDANAIAVYRRGLIFKAQLGYLSADIASQLASRMDAGEQITATVIEVTGGGLLSRRNVGVNLHLQSD